MGGYNFMWSSPSAGAPIVSIALYGITFNSAVLDILKRPEMIMIGYDEREKVIGVKPITKQEDDGKGFVFAERERRGNVRIGNKDFLRYIATSAELNLEKSEKFIASWDEQENILIVDLNTPLDDLDDNENIAGIEEGDV